MVCTPAYQLVCHKPNCIHMYGALCEAYLTYLYGTAKFVTQ
jgi:hypothetical protein